MVIKVHLRNTHSSSTFELVRAMMTPGSGRRRHGIRRTGSLRRLAGAGHLKAAGSGVIGTLEATALKQAVNVPVERHTNVKRGKGRKPHISTLRLRTFLKPTDNNLTQERQLEPHAQEKHGCEC